MSDRPDSDFDDDQTAIRQVANDDKTKVRKDRSRAPSSSDETQIRGESVPGEAAGNDDATLIRGQQDKASSPDSPPDAPPASDDATIIRGDKAGDEPPARDASQDATIIRGQETPSAPSDSDATIIRGDDQNTRNKKPPSATVLREPGATSGNATILREPGKPGENATILRNPSAPSNEHATILRGGGSAADRDATTNVGGGHNESTLLRDEDNDRTVMNPARDNDSTVVGDRAKAHADTTYIAAVGKQIQSRGNSEAGRLLKNRFVLEEKVGSGGMGDVYKALDLRQQEAQERNPYIAIKILNENFARHKDAFISLQREATRTRGIPHPNIMAVYDFDREGDTVFMSMELLDGQPLDDYLKEHPEGVSVEDAWNIIDGICQGLSRAHGAGIVHSDFKPGNIYYTGSKIAKVFDFGIARAVANPLEQQGEKTVFDAGTLGALTPTYASYEMLTGKEPIKSDDVYAV
ncbi:MAG: serine/threonine protein kinase, partial [Pseudomonadales bacterium]|nr:serine/threonine protein kinase [Pseudomonadales bacterium]